jgi:hypothetical protein
MLPASRAAEPPAQWGGLGSIKVLDVVSRAADFERLKVASPLDVADIAIGRKVDENRQPCVTTADGNPESDLSTDLEPEFGTRSASHTGKNEG